MGQMPRLGYWIIGIFCITSCDLFKPNVANRELVPDLAQFSGQIAFNNDFDLESEFKRASTRKVTTAWRTYDFTFSNIRSTENTFAFSAPDSTRFTFRLNDVPPDSVKSSVFPVALVFAAYNDLNGNDQWDAAYPDQYFQKVQEGKNLENLYLKEKAVLLKNSNIFKENPDTVVLASDTFSIAHNSVYVRCQGQEYLLHEYSSASALEGNLGNSLASILHIYSYMQMNWSKIDLFFKFKYFEELFPIHVSKLEVATDRDSVLTTFFTKRLTPIPGQEEKYCSSLIHTSRSFHTLINHNLNSNYYLSSSEGLWEGFSIPVAGENRGRVENLFGYAKGYETLFLENEEEVQNVKRILKKLPGADAFEMPGVKTGYNLIWCDDESVDCKVGNDAAIQIDISSVPRELLISNHDLSKLVDRYSYSSEDLDAFEGGWHIKERDVRVEFSFYQRKGELWLQVLDQIDFRDNDVSSGLFKLNGTAALSFEVPLANLKGNINSTGDVLSVCLPNGKWYEAIRHSSSYKVATLDVIDSLASRNISESDGAPISQAIYFGGELHNDQIALFPEEGYLKTTWFNNNAEIDFYPDGNGTYFDSDSDYSFELKRNELGEITELIVTQGKRTYFVGAQNYAPRHPSIFSLTDAIEGHQMIRLIEGKPFGVITSKGLACRENQPEKIIASNSTYIASDHNGDWAEINESTPSITFALKGLKDKVVALEIETCTEEDLGRSDLDVRHRLEITGGDSNATNQPILYESFDYYPKNGSVAHTVFINPLVITSDPYYLTISQKPVKEGVATLYFHSLKILE